VSARRAPCQLAAKVRIRCTLLKGRTDVDFARELDVDDAQRSLLEALQDVAALLCRIDQSRGPRFR
jgi:hypothetical protein